MRALLLLALLGFVVCLSVHAVAWAGSTIEPGPVLLALFVGLMAVWIPAVALQNKTRRGGEILWEAAPAWMRMLCKMLFVYGVVLFIALGVIRWRSGNPSQTRDGTYVVRHGKTAQPISETTYRHMQNQELIFFSGWLLMFYFSATTAFASGVVIANRS